jgi:hypothetical protein
VEPAALSAAATDCTLALDSCEASMPRSAALLAQKSSSMKEQGASPLAWATSSR